MTQVKITEACLIRGEHHPVGKVLEVPDIFAHYLVRIRRAVLVAQTPALAVATGTERAVSPKGKKN